MASTFRKQRREECPHCHNMIGTRTWEFHVENCIKSMTRQLKLAIYTKTADRHKSDYLNSSRYDTSLNESKLNASERPSRPVTRTATRLAVAKEKLVGGAEQEHVPLTRCGLCFIKLKPGELQQHAKQCMES